MSKQSVRRQVRAVLVLSLLCPVVACSTFGSRYQAVRVSSDPSGAEVFVDGGLLGVTPLKARMRRNQDLILEVRKPGYDTGFRELDAGKPSTLGMLDMIGGCIILIPFFGMLSDAAWDYEPSTFIVHLDEDPLK